MGSKSLGYLDGSIRYPISSHTSSSSSTLQIPNSTYDYWIKHDQLILINILSFVSETLLTQVIGLTTSHEVLLFLEKLFFTTSFDSVMNTRYQLSILKKFSLSIDGYFIKVKQLVKILSTISWP